MKRYIHLAAAFLAAAAAAGCEVGTRGTNLSLGNVNYDEAFGQAREVMSQYFSVASADDNTGVIESRPKPIEAGPEGIFRHSEARQIAKLTLRREGEAVLANLAVEVQRQGSAVHHQLQMAASGYDSVPNRTPSEIDAATTAEQNEAWETETYDSALELKVLRQIYEALHGER
ncbi:MAG: hypothetical protein ACYTF6_06130 [Planctomycetota bacterium]|jgi:hypothetical protein